MSDLRARRAFARGRGLFALVILTLLVAVGCGSGEGDPHTVPAGIDLPAVGTLGRQPRGPGTIAVDVTADGHISIGEQGPLSLLGLRDELQRRTADPAWREPDHTSLKILLVNADASLPWTVAQWIMQTAADPAIAISRIFFGARAMGGGSIGALGCSLPRDGPHGCVDFVDPPPHLAVRVVPRDGRPSEPEDVLAPLRIAAGEQPLSRLTLELKSVRGKNGEIPTGFVVRLVDVALRAGVRNILFEGAAVSREFEGGDVEGLLDHVARLRANLKAPVLEVNREVVGPLPRSEPVPEAKGRLAHLHGSRVEKEEPKPAADTHEVTIAAEVVEEELQEVEETEDIHPGELLEPVIKDEEIEDHVETDSDLPYEEALGAEGLVDAPFVGPFGASRPRAGAFPTREREGERERGVEAALRWLAAHQSPNGGWESAGFGRWCDGEVLLEADRAGGWGRASHDVGVTGLALCAFLGAGYTNRGRHPYAKTVSKGLRYLKNVQDPEGCFGPRTPGRFVYAHAAAALAMVEAYGMTESPIFKGSARKALEFIFLCRNPYVAWRYGVKPGDNDTSVTAWMAMPVFSARWINADAERRDRTLPFEIDGAVFDGIHAWIEKMTDPRTGRTGYLQRGGMPDRDPAVREFFPPESSESTTAAAVLLRLLLGEDSQRSEALGAGVALLEALPPAWDPDAGTIDPVYWYFGTLATHQVGGQAWQTWAAALQGVVSSSQRTDGESCRYLGSWDPIGPWGLEGGRVASTALLAMCLEVDTRYERVRPMR
jgi:hypothetical protein